MVYKYVLFSLLKQIHKVVDFRYKLSVTLKMKSFWSLEYTVSFIGLFPLSQSFSSLNSVDFVTETDIERNRGSRYYLSPRVDHSAKRVSSPNVLGLWRRERDLHGTTSVQECNSRTLL